MENRTYYYARVSSKEQNLDRQLSAFPLWGLRSGRSSPIKRVART